jgi:hypothetical protein
MAVLKVNHPVAEYQWIEEVDYDPKIHTLIKEPEQPNEEAQPPKDIPPPKGK